MSESKWQPDDVALITYGTERSGGKVRAIRAHDHKGWVFPGHGGSAMFVYDDAVSKVEPVPAMTRTYEEAAGPARQSVEETLAEAREAAEKKPITCFDCFASVMPRDLEMHRKWHTHLDRWFDIAVGSPFSGLFRGKRK